MNSRQRWENQGATLFSGKPCQIITSNSGLFFDLSGEVSHTETAWMLGESDRLPLTGPLPESQSVEASIDCAVLNKMVALGMPERYRITPD